MPELAAPPATPPAAPIAPAPAAPPVDAAPPAPAGDPPAPPASDPPQPEVTWRHRIAGEDKAYLKTLERYTDEAAYGRAQRALHQKVSAGELKPPPAPFPEKGTPEEQAAWRQDQGIPADPKEYKLELPEGLVLGEADKPGVERLTAFAHKNNWTPAQLNGVMSAYYDQMDFVKGKREEADAQHHDASDLELREAWKGADYKRNLQAIHNFLDTAPKDVKDRLMGGRTSEGRLIANDPVMLKWLAQTALEQNPAASLLPSGSQNMAGLGSELEQIRKYRRENPDGYDNDKKMQARELELISAQQKMTRRAS